ncbi:MAG: hypothetical protein JSV67_03290 [Thermoplasmatales archaeon]|nr:MAG: hypothetical protein JSV67_03290 [Thermoplasmatales archaeon]
MRKGLINKSIVLILIFTFLIANFTPLTLSSNMNKLEFRKTLNDEDITVVPHDVKDENPYQNKVSARVWLRGWLYGCENRGEIITAYAMKLYYI